MRPLLATSSPAPARRSPAADQQELTALLSRPPPLALQPIHGAGHIWSEVLLRPAQSSAESIVSLAGACGWAAALDLHVAKHAFAAMTPGHRYSVNVSPLSLADRAFVYALIDDAWVRKLDHHQLVLEILEHPRLSEQQLCVACGSVRLLRAVGIQIALDDVGRLPQQFPIELVDILKLDRSLTVALRDTNTHWPRLNVTHWVRQGLMVVAEGIESNADLERIRDCGVSVWQGHHGGYPQTWREIR